MADGEVDQAARSGDRARRTRYDEAADVLTTATGNGVRTGLTRTQRAELYGIARQTWRFFEVVVDSRTHLPRDTLHLEDESRGAYASPTDIGVYLWSVIAALDLRLVDRADAVARLSKTLDTLEHLAKWNGLLLSWYDTATGRPLQAPGKPWRRSRFEGALISTVDNAWYATGLIVTRQALPELGPRVTAQLEAMRLDIFYDERDQEADPTAGQLYGGYVVGRGPTAFHYSLLNTETRIAAYIGIGTQAIPGAVWWRAWRTHPADVEWQGETPRGFFRVYQDPQSGQPHTIFEGHYSYAGIPFVPSWGGSMFEGLMPSLVVPETTWGPRSFGQNNRNYALAQIVYARRTLGYPVWGLSPSSTPGEAGAYVAYGARGLAANRNRCPYAEAVVTPHASFLALDVLPREAFANIQAMRDRYDLDGPYGLLDSVNPCTGEVSQRYLVLDQAMILAALANALGDRALQRHFGADSVGATIRPYLAGEEFSIHDAERRRVD